MKTPEGWEFGRGVGDWRSGRHPSFPWVNTVLGNLKGNIVGVTRWVGKAPSRPALDRAVDAAYEADGGQKSWSGDLDRVKFLFLRYKSIAPTKATKRISRIQRTALSAD